MNPQNLKRENEELRNEIKELKAASTKIIATLNLDSPLWQLTIREFIELMKRVEQPPIINKIIDPENIEFGILGIMKTFNVKRSTACKIKKSGAIDGAISKIGAKRFSIDAIKARKLLNKYNDEKK
jgi:hypothetical protein